MDSHSYKKEIFGWVEKNDVASLKAFALSHKGFDYEIHSDMPTKPTPLILAAEFGYKEIARVLLDNGARLETTDVNQNTPMHIASRDGHNEMIDLFLEYLLLLNPQNSSGETPLHLAVINDHPGVAKRLIDEGADLSIKDNNSLTARQYIKFGQNEMRYVFESDEQKRKDDFNRGIIFAMLLFLAIGSFGYSKLKSQTPQTPQPPASQPAQSTHSVRIKITTYSASQNIMKQQNQNEKQNAE